MSKLFKLTNSGDTGSAIPVEPYEIVLSDDGSGNYRITISLKDTTIEYDVTRNGDASGSFGLLGTHLDTYNKNNILCFYDEDERLAYDPVANNHSDNDVFLVCSVGGVAKSKFYKWTSSTWVVIGVDFTGLDIIIVWNWDSFSKSRVSVEPIHEVAQKSTMFIVKKSANRADLYFTGSDHDPQGVDDVLHTLNESDVNLINEYSDYVLFFDDIAARDAAVISANKIAYVIDASADPLITSGAATYAYRHSNTTWYLM